MSECQRHHAGIVVHYFTQLWGTKTKPSLVQQSKQTILFSLMVAAAAVVGVGVVKTGMVTAHSTFCN